MVTVDFQNIVNAYIDKLASVYMLPMDEQEEAFSNSKRQFLSELDKLQQKHPLLSHYDSILLATDPEKVIQVIKDNTKGKDSLDCITTCERYYFKFRDFEITQPRIIDLNEKPNMIISTSDNLSDSDYLYEMLLNILLSMPLGLVHISVVNTSLSNKAKRFIQLVSNSAFDVYTNENELAFLRWQMTKRLEQCIAKGNFKRYKRT